MKTSSCLEKLYLKNFEKLLVYINKVDTFYRKANKTSKQHLSPESVNGYKKNYSL